MKHCVHS